MAVPAHTQCRCFSAPGCRSHATGRGGAYAADGKIGAPPERSIVTRLRPVVSIVPVQRPRRPGSTEAQEWKKAT